MLENLTFCLEFLKIRQGVLGRGDREVGEAGALEEKRITETRSRTGDELGFGGGQGRARVVDKRKKQIRASGGQGKKVRILLGYKLEGCRDD